MKTNTIIILGRRWFDRVNGNTYHSARVLVNGELVATVPFQYGYGNQFEWNAVDSLEKSKAAHRWKKREHYANGAVEPGWSWIRDRLGFAYTVDVAECSKRECKAWGEA